MNKTLIVLVSITPFLGMLGFALDAYSVRQRLAISSLTLDGERTRASLLSDEIQYLNTKLAVMPKYIDGYRDAIIRAGFPSQQGSYQDGFFAASTAIGDGEFLDGVNFTRKQYGLPPVEKPEALQTKTSEQESDSNGKIRESRLELLKKFEELSPYKYDQD